MNSVESRSIILLISCPDRKGIIASVTRFIAEHSGNILDLDQHVDLEQNIFFMRIEWEEKGFKISADELPHRLKPLTDEFQMRWEIRYSDHVPRMAIFVSKETHCLYDLLARVQSGEWKVHIPLVIGNHAELESVIRKFDLLFHHISITPETKQTQESKERELLRSANVDLIVLARYMQVLSDDFVKRFPNRIINIHHSFLPAFPGAKPYHSAYGRGVKIIGATSHYVTAELDAGPIIEQDIIRVSHKDSLDDFIRKGKDLEKIVLSRAIWWHLQNKILVYNNKTVIFE